MEHWKGFSWKDINFGTEQYHERPILRRNKTYETGIIRMIRSPNKLDPATRSMWRKLIGSISLRPVTPPLWAFSTATLLYFCLVPYKMALFPYTILSRKTENCQKWISSFVIAVIVFNEGFCQWKILSMSLFWFKFDSVAVLYLLIF